MNNAAIGKHQNSMFLIVLFFFFIVLFLRLIVRFLKGTECMLGYQVRDTKWIKVLLNELDRIIDSTDRGDVFFGNYRLIF